VSRRVALALGLCAALLVSGCSVHGLSFVQDDRLSLQTPSDGARVSLPLRVSWSVKDFTITGPTGQAAAGAGYFGVFVDRPPPTPGDTVESLVRNDRSCKAIPGCPDAEFLAHRGAYTTTATDFVLDRLPNISTDDEHGAHDVIVVLLDGAGRRIGESAVHAEFRVAS
jgi:hypothetical protein